jgi:hypothetical protein
VITSADVEKVQAAEEARLAAIQVDVFTPEEYYRTERKDTAQQVSAGARKAANA